MTFNPASGYNFATTTFSSDLSQVGAFGSKARRHKPLAASSRSRIPINLTGPDRERPAAGHRLGLGYRQQQRWDIGRATG